MKKQVVIEIDVDDNNIATTINTKIKDGLTLVSLTPILGWVAGGIGITVTTRLIAVFEKEIVV